MCYSSFWEGNEDVYLHTFCILFIIILPISKVKSLKWSCYLYAIWGISFPPWTIIYQTWVSCHVMSCDATQFSRFYLDAFSPADTSTSTAGTWCTVWGCYSLSHYLQLKKLGTLPNPLEMNRFSRKKPLELLAADIQPYSPRIPCFCNSPASNGCRFEHLGYLFISRGGALRNCSGVANRAVISWGTWWRENRMNRSLWMNMVSRNT